MTEDGLRWMASLTVIGHRYVYVMWIVKFSYDRLHTDKALGTFENLITARTRQRFRVQQSISNNKRGPYGQNGDTTYNHNGDNTEIAKRRTLSKIVGGKVWKTGGAIISTGEWWRTCVRVPPVKQLKCSVFDLVRHFTGPAFSVTSLALVASLFWLLHEREQRLETSPFWFVAVLACHRFYRAMHFSAFARSWDRMSSVRPSVRLSVTLVICDHIGWKSWKLIAQTISATPSLIVAKRRSTYSQGNMGKFGGD